MHKSRAMALSNRQIQKINGTKSLARIGYGHNAVHCTNFGMTAANLSISV